jgi:hypothetical protein
MLSRKTIPLVAVCLFFVVAAAFGQPGTIYTISISSTLPPVGLASTETAQVNVTNAAVAPSPGSVPPSCTGNISFYDANGTVIGKPTNFALGSRQVFSVPLPFASTGATGSRTVIRAEISFMQAVAGFGIPSCTLESSLEIYDTATGVTHAVLAGTPPPGLMGVIRSGAPSLSQ